MAEEDLKKAEERIIDLFVGVNSDFGNDAVCARLVSLIFLSPEEVSMESLVSSTGYSPSTICNKTRMLVEAGVLKKVGKPGTKKIFFSMEKDMKKVILGAFRKILKVKVAPIKDGLPERIAEYKKYIKKSDKDSMEKLKIVENYLMDINVIEKKMAEFIKSLEAN